MQFIKSINNLILQVYCLKTELIITQRSKPFIKTKIKKRKKTTQEEDAIIEYIGEKND